MRIRTILSRIKTRRRPPRQMTEIRVVSDWTTMFTARDWADMPVHHPLRDE